MPSGVSVRLSREGKELLERLQAIVEYRLGKRYSLQEVLDAAVRLSAKRLAELIAELEGGGVRLPRRAAEELLEEASFEGRRGGMA